MEELPIIIFIIGILVHLSAGEAGIAVLAGQNTTLPCIFEGMPWHVNWLKEDGPSWNGIASYGDNTNYGTIDDGKYSVQEHFSSGKSSFSLSIAEVEIADDGRYRCAVTDNYGTSSSSLYHLEVLDALNTSVTTPALHGSTPTTPTSTQTVTTTTTDSRDQTVDDTGSGISLAAKFGIAFGVMIPVGIAVFGKLLCTFRKFVEVTDVIHGDENLLNSAQ
ncbi:uncharacterized protein LOC105438774 [Strongylocentrotus purpuratus]|uniref:Ig-like domain-containing protein n=1 Tax=Strongylocentrotus purpuratus TaxID=7668 RepID=A0A7M7P2Y1_STRPU|nr:uncharacterized protein LOC105438774 [Strongylocentrotus purpuratus]